MGTLWRQRRRQKHLAAIVVVALGGALAAPAALAAKPTLSPAWAPYVEVETLAAHSDDSWLLVAGRLGYDEEHTQLIRSPINGRVTRVYVQLGQRVQAGDRLFKLVSAEAAQLKAELTKDAEDVAVYSRARRRMQSLLKDGAVSPREAAEAEAAFNKAIAEQARDREHVQALGLDVNAPGAEAIVVARMPGVVTAKDVVLGTELRADADRPLVVISDLDGLWLWANVFERDLPRVSQGAAVRATVAAWPGRHFAGVVDYVGDVVDAETHSVRVRCTLANKERALKPHMFADVAISEPGQERIWLKTEAVILQGDQTFAIGVGEGDALELREVRLGAIVQGRQPVVSGLKVGDRVISKGAVLVAQQLARAAKGSDTLSAGQKIEPPVQLPPR